MKTLDPRTLLWIVAVISTVTVFTRSLLIQSIVLAVLIVLLVLLNIPVIRSFGRVKKLMPLILFVVVAQSIFTAGTPLINIIGLSIITCEGLIAGTMTVFRLLILATSALLFTLTSESDMIHALTLLKIPHEIAFMSLIAIRFLPDYIKEFQLCLESFELRGVNIKSARLSQKAIMMQTFVTPVLIRTLFKAKRLAMSMELRGFKAYPTRTSINELSIRRHDVVVMIIALSIGILLMMGEWLI